LTRVLGKMIRQRNSSFSLSIFLVAQTAGLCRVPYGIPYLHPDWPYNSNLRSIRIHGALSALCPILACLRFFLLYLLSHPWPLSDRAAGRGAVLTGLRAYFKKITLLAPPRFVAG